MLDSVTGMALESMARVAVRPPSASTQVRSEVRELSPALGDSESMGLNRSLISDIKGLKR